MYVYEATGCPADKVIEMVTDSDPAGPCVNIDTAVLYQPGSDLNNGRIMSIAFDKV